MGNQTASRDRPWVRGVCVTILGGWLLSLQASTTVADTSEPVTMSKTIIVLKLDSEKPLAIQTIFQEHPPTIEIAFPSQRVVSSLPEHSVVSKGIVQTISAKYGTGFNAHSTRFLQSLQVVLSGPYAYRVRSEPGRVVIEVDHPASIGSAAVEVGLRGGVIIGTIGRPAISERFRAMQDALTHATLTPWTLQITPEFGASSGATTHPESLRPTSVAATASPSGTSSSSAVSHKASSLLGRKTHGAQQDRSHVSVSQLFLRGPVWVRWWSAISLALWLLAFGLIVVGTIRLWSQLRGTGVLRTVLGRSTDSQSGARIPSGVMLIDQLVWRAFERQGYQLVLETELMQPLSGTLRVMVKDGTKANLLFVGNGPYFEKQTVERFLRTMRDTKVEQGFLIASGSFTVPAQRFAKDYHITLVGREELTELLSVGAKSEYVAKQLQQQQARLEEAQQTLRRYTSELQTLRRQRNEASWYLGEERAKSAKLEAQLEAVNQQLHQHEAALQRWEQEAIILRKQWEESQWYLGEARARHRHVESQLTALQEIMKGVEGAQRGRDEANWYLGEERAKHEALEHQLAELQTDFEASSLRERLLQESLDRLKQELSALRTFGERRRHARAIVPEILVEILNGTEEPLWAGKGRNLSKSGLGIESDQELPAQTTCRVRLHLQGGEPIESKAQVVWQHAEGEPIRYRSGYQLIDLPDAARTRLEQLIDASRAPRT